MGTPTQARRPGRSPWSDFLIGALLLTACFAVLCAFAARQRDALLRGEPNLRTATAASGPATSPQP